MMARLHAAVCCEWFGFEGVGVHRWPASGNEVSLSWQRLQDQLSAPLESFGSIGQTICAVLPITERDTRRLSTARFWSSSTQSTSSLASMTISRGLTRIDDLEVYLNIPEDLYAAFLPPDNDNDSVEARRTTAASKVIKIGRKAATPKANSHSDATANAESMASQVSDKEGESFEDDSDYAYSSSEFDTDISVDEAGGFIKRTDEERSAARRERAQRVSPLEVANPEEMDPKEELTITKEHAMVRQNCAERLLDVTMGDLYCLTNYAYG